MKKTNDKTIETLLDVFILLSWVAFVLVMIFQWEWIFSSNADIFSAVADYVQYDHYPEFWLSAGRVLLIDIVLLVWLGINLAFTVKVIVVVIWGKRSEPEDRYKNGFEDIHRGI